MKYEGESHNWGWNMHCGKFNGHVETIKSWAADGLATNMSEQDKISAFLKTIPPDCKNTELVIAKVVVEGDRKRFPTLVSMVIPHLSATIVSQEWGTSDAKRTIANTHSDPGQGSSKRRKRTGISCATKGKCRLEGGKVVGTLEGLHYEENIWMAMIRKQREKVVALRKSTGSKRVIAAATTSGSEIPASAVADSVAKLATAVEALGKGKHCG